LARDDFLRFWVEGLDLVRGLTEWFVDHTGAQQVDASGNSLGLLQGKAVEIARADEVLDRGCAFFIEPERFEGLASELECRLESLAQLEINALCQEVQAMAAVE